MCGVGEQLGSFIPRQPLGKVHHSMWSQCNTRMRPNGSLNWKAEKGEDGGTGGGHLLNIYLVFYN